MNGIYDVIIIGAGVIGNAVARELSKFRLSICVIEKEPDVAFGISGRNSGVLHAGFNNAPGSLMAKFCVEGCLNFEKTAKELDISFKRTGKLVTAFFEEDIAKLEKLKEQGEKNGAKGLEIIDAARIREINPRFAGVAALYSKMTGIFNPFEYTIALSENAAQNGVKYFFEKEVSEIEKKSAVFHIRAGGETFRGRWAINCAGLESDDICRLAGIRDYTIYPCRGEYYILDKALGSCLNMPVYPVPNEKAGGLGIHLTPTLGGNIMIGPSAEYIDEKEDYVSTREVMDNLYRDGKQLFPIMEKKHFIRSFSGIRPKLTDKSQGGYSDFVIRESDRVPNFIILTGIESPGLTSSIPIACKVVSIIQNKERLIPNEAFNPYRKRRTVFSKLTFDEKEEAIKRNSAYGRIVCRCEEVSEAEILEAAGSIMGTVTMKGIKNRTRAGMGRCQGSFCSVRIVEILEKKMGIDPLELKWGTGSGKMFTGRTRK